MIIIKILDALWNWAEGNAQDNYIKGDYSKSELWSKVSQMLNSVLYKLKRRFK